MGLSYLEIVWSFWVLFSDLLGKTRAMFSLEYCILPLLRKGISEYSTQCPVNYGVFQKSSWWEQALFPALWSNRHSFPLIITGGSFLVWGSWLKQQISILLNTQRGSSADLEHFLLNFLPNIISELPWSPWTLSLIFFQLRKSSSFHSHCCDLGTLPAVSQFRKLYGSLHFFHLRESLAFLAVYPRFFDSF